MSRVLRLTLAYDWAGNQLWANMWPGPQSHALFLENWPATELAVSPDETMVFTTGGARGLDDSRDWGTTAIDAATGMTVWARTYGTLHYYTLGLPVVDPPLLQFDSFNQRTEVPASLEVSPDGESIYVSGRTYSQPNPSSQEFRREATTIAYAARP
jgi:DNA-binding beta-propeller fold protein YncE